MIQIAKLSKEEFDPIIEATHFSVFDDAVEGHFFRYDFALVTSVDSNPVSYIIAQEKSPDTVELSYGGTVYSERGSKSMESFLMVYNELAKTYTNAIFQVLNTNVKMLKLAIGSGALITGTSLNNEGKTYVLFNKKLKEEK